MNLSKTISIICILLSIILAGCSVDHTGLAITTIDGQRYDVDCRFLVSGSRDGIPVTEEQNVVAQICSNGPPSNATLDRSCRQASEANEINLGMDDITFRGYDLIEAIGAERSADETPCQLAATTGDGGGDFIGLTSALTFPSGAVVSSSVRPDGSILFGADSLTNSFATAVDSELRVGAKFAKWRYANTRTSGSIDFDRYDCDDAQNCEINIRQAVFELDDFTIVRPTILARDVSVRNARLLTVNNIKTRVDATGSFEVSGIQAVVTSVINGEEVRFISNSALNLQGQFSLPLHDSNHASLWLTLSLDFRSGDFSVKGTTQFFVNKFPTKFENAASLREPLCITGGPSKELGYPSSAKYCSTKTRDQTWYLQIKQSYLQLRQLPTNNCLTVQKKSKGYSGGVVNTMPCSDDEDQRWWMDSSGRIIHIASQQCLNIAEDTNDLGLVDCMQSCADLLDPTHAGGLKKCNQRLATQQWLVRRPG